MKDSCSDLQCKARYKSALCLKFNGYNLKVKKSAACLPIGFLREKIFPVDKNG